MAEKKSKVFEELDGKTHTEQEKIIREKVRNKKYKRSQFKELTQAFKNDAVILQAIIDSLRLAKASVEIITKRQSETFNRACSTAEKVINDPNSKEQAKVEALKLINDAYKFVTAVNVVAIIGICFLISSGIAVIAVLAAIALKANE